jgi:hypothetical protein
MSNRHPKDLCACGKPKGIESARCRTCENKSRALGVELTASEYYHRYTLAARAKNPDRHAAHEAVRKALRAGELVKGPCEVCGKTEDDGIIIQVHHWSYATRIIGFACAGKCHLQLDRMRRIIERQEAIIGSKVPWGAGMESSDGFSFSFPVAREDRNLPAPVAG